MTENTVRVVIPLTIRKKNGRPKILPPVDYVPAEERTQDAHVVRAIARAWSWRRKLESGEASTIADIAKTEKVTDQYVGRTMRLAYLAPDVLEKLLIHRIPPALPLNDLVGVVELPWAEQMEAVFNASPNKYPSENATFSISS
ncbi:hypothetical protein [Nitrobacter sp. TKz-YC01]|uniref:hypothetical protein n=1 Tax=Nitrobacter sp. TKz-YC01 TaxID=3398703 RepID=UPI003A0FC7B4